MSSRERGLGLHQRHDRVAQGLFGQLVVPSGDLRDRHTRFGLSRRAERDHRHHRRSRSQRSRRRSLSTDFRHHLRSNRSVHRRQLVVSHRTSGEFMGRETSSTSGEIRSTPRLGRPSDRRTRRIAPHHGPIHSRRQDAPHPFVRDDPPASAMVRELGAQRESSGRRMHQCSDSHSAPNSKTTTRWHFCSHSERLSRSPS